jgi:NB-ARC domain
MTEAASFSGWSADLPLDVTTFVGRRSERSQIRELMSASRLVTLTGFGGIGKSRLALRMASDLRRVFPDGVYVVALGEVAHADAVPGQIAASLGLHGRSNQSSMIAVVEYLRPRTALVVLDNCEHVVEIAALIADTLIRTSPGVKLLVTSREPLRVNGEAVHPVKPLSVPGQAYDDSPLQEYEAVQLFLDRARTIAPNFSLSEDNRRSSPDSTTSTTSGVRDGLLGLGPFLPSDLDVDRRLVDAPLPGQLIRVQLQPELPSCLQPSVARPIPTRLCLCRLPHRGPPLP